MSYSIAVQLYFSLTFATVLKAVLFLNLFKIFLWNSRVKGTLYKQGTAGIILSFDICTLIFCEVRLEYHTSLIITQF